MEYTTEDLFYSVNDIYAQLDDGAISADEAREILLRCCSAYIDANSTK